jgi:predicted membrane-bound spermidine synthase
MKKYALEVAVFLCGTALMIIELTGSRILSPYFGTTTISWTVLIGTIMAFLSLGYYFGGRWADTKAKRENLSNIILLSAVAVFAIIPSKIALLRLLSDKLDSYDLGIILASLLLFAAPSFLLGTISPYATKLRIVALKSSGRAVGNLYAISTVGSIAGTFLAGLYLIPRLGSNNIIYLVIVLLLAASFLVDMPKLLSKKTLLVILLLVLCLVYYLKGKPILEDLIDVDTRYTRVWIYSRSDWFTGRPLRVLKTDPRGTVGGIFLDKDDDLPFRYLKYFRLADFFKPDIQEALTIGGGSYAYPKDFLKKHPEANLDVVEIDPGITALARKYFNLSDNPRLNIITQDGRIYLNRNLKKYDAIYIDAFNSMTVPYQLTTKEAIQKMSDSLTDEGVVVLNIISALEGGKSDLIRAELKTYQSVFPTTYLFRVDDRSPEVAQNIILLAVKGGEKSELKSENSELNDYLSMLVKDDMSTHLPVVTDDFASTDYYTLKLYR